MTAEQFIYWLEGYVKGSKIDLTSRMDILNKLEEVKKKSENKEPIPPATWPNSKTTYPIVSKEIKNPYMYAVNSTADFSTFNSDTLTNDKNQLKLPFKD